MGNAKSAVETLLPLQLATFHILMSLAEGERHGYAIILDVETRTGGDLKLSPGTLYRSIQRMQQQGLIVEARRRPPAAHYDERRRYYRITSFGADVARAEATRLQRLVQLAKSSGFAPGKA